jgi:endonuclease/exonuclease/phosphatase family metal-dependent hydrolase
MSHPFPRVLAALLVLSSASPGAGARDAAPEPPSLKIVSLNLAMREDVDGIAAELSAAHLVRDADVVLFQEVISRDGQPDVASRLGEAFGLRSVFRPAFALDSHRQMGLAILTRNDPGEPRVLRLKRFELSFRSRDRIALGVLIETPSGPVRVYDVHLDTRINLGDRLEQLSAVIHDLDTGETPVIVGGDFNTNDNRWLFHTIPLPVAWYQREGLLRFMRAQGFSSAVPGWAATHDAFGMQLDWIFVRGLDALSSVIQPLKMSDHHALVASISRPRPPQSTPGR